MKKELALLAALYGATLATKVLAQQTTVVGVPPTVQLPGTYLGPNGGIKVECIAGTCTGSGPGAPAATVAIDQTTDGTTNGVYVRNWPLSFGISGTVDVSDRSGRLLGSIANTGFNITNFPATQAVTQSGVFTVGRSWNLLNTTDSVNIGNYPATQAVSGTLATTQSGAWNVEVNNFPTTATTSAISVRCVDAAGSAFESCAGAGGGTSSSVAISQTGTDNDVDAAISNWPATQAVTQSGTWTIGVNNFPATQPVSGTVGVNNFPATQPVSGTVSVGNFPATQVVTPKPSGFTGCYAIAANTPTYAGLAANTPLFSARWGSATAVGIVYQFSVTVVTSVSATAAGITERQLIFARSFTVSDTGGTALTLTGNNQKLRTSFSTSGFTDMRIGAPLTAGTRTLDANPISSALGWSGLLSTGLAIGSSAGSAVGAARSTEGGTGPVRLLDTFNGDQPIVLAQNEGIIMRIGVVQPTGSTQQTFIIMKWCEATSY